MTTNAGTKILTTEADILSFGKAMVDTTQSANVLGFSHLVENFKVTYDSGIEDAFIVHTKWGPLKFVNKERLYVYEPLKQYYELVKHIKANKATLNSNGTENHSNGTINQSDVELAGVSGQNKTQNDNPTTAVNNAEMQQSSEPQSSQPSEIEIEQQVCQAIPSVAENLKSTAKGKSNEQIELERRIEPLDH